MEKEDILEMIEHPNQNKYPAQKIATVMINDYAYLFDYVQKNDEIFLKTMLHRRGFLTKH